MTNQLEVVVTDEALSDDTKLVLADVLRLRPTLSDEMKQKIIAILRSKNWEAYFNFCYSTNEDTLNSRGLRFLKGNVIETLIAYVVGGTVLDQVGYDLGIPCDGFEHRAELKYGSVGSDSKTQKGVVNVIRKLKNTQSNTSQTLCPIHFDYLLVPSNEQVLLYFADELEGKIYSLGDGFDVRLTQADGHLLAENTLDPTDSLIVRNTLGDSIRDTIKNFVEQCASPGFYIGREKIKERPSSTKRSTYIRPVKVPKPKKPKKPKKV